MIREEQLRRIVREEIEKAFGMNIQILDEKIETIRKELQPTAIGELNEVVNGKSAAARLLGISRQWFDRYYKKGILDKAVISENANGRVLFDRNILQNVMRQINEMKKERYIYKNEL